jgi:hypothetical protein
MLSNIQNGQSGLSVRGLINQIVDLFNARNKFELPIGSLYLNASDSTNPATLLGYGTWVAFGAGRVPVGFDAAQTEFNEAQKVGGAKTHTLTHGQLPAHQHNTGALHTTSFEATGYGLTVAANFVNRPVVWKGGSGDGAVNPGVFTTSIEGSSQPHNNLQPYITVYMWMRTA